MSAATTLRQRWQALAPRERRALAWLTFVTVFAIAAQLAWQAWFDSPELGRQLALRRAELAHMQHIASEAQRPADAAAPPPGATLTPEARLAVVTGQLGSLGALTARPGADGSIELNGSVDFNALVAWLARLHGATGLRVLAFEASPAAASGSVNVHVELAAP